MGKAMRTLFAAISLFICAAASKEAFATDAGYTCSPANGHQITSVQWDGSALFITCNGFPGLVSLFALPGTTCYHPITIDTVKLWESLASTAFLSGMGVHFDADDSASTCPGAAAGWPGIHRVILQPASAP